MRRILAVLILIGGVQASVLMLQGCKRHTAPPPVQPVVRSVPRMSQPDIPGPLPVDGGDVAPVERRVPPRRVVPTDQGQDRAAQAAAATAAQARGDARLLRRQQTASQQQQRELNGDVKKYSAEQQQVQDEPRIQDAPEPPASSGLGPDAPRIQDAPGEDQAQPGQAQPRIQDAPGPPQTQPAQPQSAPQS